MSQLLETLEHRRSQRRYTGEPIEKELLDQIVKAGNLAPSSRNLRPVEIIVITDPEMLEKISHSREYGAKHVANAGACIVVIGNAELSDTWIEDCTIALSYMNLMADHLGLGSCWIQGRNRDADAKTSTEDYLRELLDFPETFRLEGMLAIGHIRDHLPAHTPTTDNVFYEDFNNKEEQ